MRCSAIFAVLAVTLSAAVAAPCAPAGKPVAPIAADCAECHAKAEKPVTAHALKGSVHEALGCTDCHTDIRELPHADKPAKATCTPCHDKEVAAWKASPHAAKVGGATCASCHGSHQVKSAGDPSSIRSGIRQVEVCGACHAKQPGPRGGTGQAWIMDYKKSVHGEGVLKSGLNIAPSCATCHGAHGLKVLKANDAASKLRLAETCGTCHKQAYEAYRVSIHAAALARGMVASPTCTDCHGEHTIQGPGGPGSSVAPLAVTATCGKCHGNRASMANFDVPSDRVSTFMDSYHGVALSEGDVKAANCASCHGNHDVRPSSDPASMTNPNNLEKTCGTCHPKAGKGFASVKFHQTVSPTGARGAWFVRVFYIGFTGILILGFVLHILAEMYARAKGRGILR